MISDLHSFTLAELPCTTLKGVGQQLAARLASCGITTVQDLLFHLPFRYQDRTRITPIGGLRQGDYAVIEGVIAHTELSKGRKPSLLCYLRDGTGGIKLRFFHFYAAQKAGLAPGTRLRCFGEVRSWSADLEMIHPEYQKITANEAASVAETLTPIYSTTEGLQQRSLRNLTDQALALLDKEIALPEYLPKKLLENFNLPNLTAALRYVHRPPPDAPVDLLIAGQHPAQQRLAFEELLAHHLSLRRLRQRIQAYQAPSLNCAGSLLEKFLSSLSFTLTVAQQRVAEEITCDIRQTRPMLRLVQGDVGSGKTVVAALALIQAVENGYQAALMAPTELLAEQHYRNFHQWLAPLGIQVVWLVSKAKGKARRQTLDDIASGQAQIIIGTHALFQESVNFLRLGLIVVDEQHRFGVQQRLALRAKGTQQGFYPHQLMMTATPIPRTLAMTAYADLDVSVINELPPGRTPVTTIVIPGSRRPEIIERIRSACQENRQAYWVCTLIEESEVLECQAAEVTAVQLRQWLPEITVGLVHGRMKSSEKEQIMADFKAGNISLLVATTVIEVGVDVPNASLMVIENPERLGLAQLHQLRGRVGRGSIASHCVLLYQYPLSEQAKSRLRVMREISDGFEIARRDLELRGPGEVLGTRQTGIMQLKIADLLRDQNLLSDVQQAAQILLQDYSSHVEPLIRRWLAAGEQYGWV